MKLVQFDFPYGGPWGEEMAQAHSGLAKVIGDTPGLVWKIWIENREKGEAGGIYLFADEKSAADYIKEHTARLEGFGLKNIRAKVFDVNEGLNRITRATFCEKGAGAGA